MWRCRHWRSALRRGWYGGQGAHLAAIGADRVAEQRRIVVIILIRRRIRWALAHPQRVTQAGKRAMQSRRVILPDPLAGFRYHGRMQTVLMPDVGGM